MHLYHQDLIPYLSQEQLLKQHYVICKIRGSKWNKQKDYQEYIYCHPYQYLYAFHLLIIKALEKYQFFVNPLWKDACYRGMGIGYEVSSMTFIDKMTIHHPIYPEHNQDYYEQCLKELKMIHKNE